MTDIWAIIPSGYRHAQLIELVGVLRRDDIKVVVIDTGYSPPLASDSSSFIVVRDLGPRNISRWWNIGMDCAESLAGTSKITYAVLNDDVIVNGDQLRRLASEMYRHRATAAFPNQFGHEKTYQLVHARPVDLRMRMPGFCFVLDGTTMLRADENLVWWYGDDDLDWRARQLGGSLMVQDVTVQHTNPNGWQSQVPALIEQTGHDRATFLTKWGNTPW